MANKQGFVALYRKFQDNFLWQDKRVFSRAEAWIDILLAVRWSEEEEKVLIQNHIVTCGYGQSLKSLGTWAKRWKWSRSKVSRFFTLMQSENMIRTESVQKSTRLTVCNFKQYQKLRNDDETMMKRKRTDDETMMNTEEPEQPEQPREPKEHTRATSETDATLAVPGPASLSDLLKRYSETQQATIDEYWNMQRRSRQTGKIASSVIVKWMDKWSTYDAAVVIEGMSVHMDKAAGKLEPYTHGIIRRVHKSGIDPTGNNGGTKAEYRELIGRARSILRDDGEDSCREWCEMKGVQFKEVCNA